MRGLNSMCVYYVNVWSLHALLFVTRPVADATLLLSPAQVSLQMCEGAAPPGKVLMVQVFSDLPLVSGTLAKVRPAAATPPLETPPTCAASSIRCFLSVLVKDGKENLGYPDQTASL